MTSFLLSLWSCYFNKAYIPSMDEKSFKEKKQSKFEKLDDEEETEISNSIHKTELLFFKNNQCYVNSNNDIKQKCSKYNFKKNEKKKTYSEIDNDNANIKHVKKKEKRSSYVESIGDLVTSFIFRSLGYKKEEQIKKKEYATDKYPASNNNSLNDIFDSKSSDELFEDRTKPRGKQSIFSSRKICDKIIRHNRKSIENGFNRRKLKIKIKNNENIPDNQRKNNIEGIYVKKEKDKIQNAQKNKKTKKFDSSEVTDKNKILTFSNSNFTKKENINGYMNSLGSYYLSSSCLTCEENQLQLEKKNDRFTISEGKSMITRNNVPKVRNTSFDLYLSSFSCLNDNDVSSLQKNQDPKKCKTEKGNDANKCIKNNLILKKKLIFDRIMCHDNKNSNSKNEDIFFRKNNTKLFNIRKGSKNKLKKDRGIATKEARRKKNNRNKRNIFLGTISCVEPLANSSFFSSPYYAINVDLLEDPHIWPTKKLKNLCKSLKIPCNGKHRKQILDDLILFHRTNFNEETDKKLATDCSDTQQQEKLEIDSSSSSSSVMLKKELDCSCAKKSNFRNKKKNTFCCEINHIKNDAELNSTIGGKTKLNGRISNTNTLSNEQKNNRSDGEKKEASNFTLLRVNSDDVPDEYKLSVAKNVKNKSDKPILKNKQSNCHSFYYHSSSILLKRNKSMDTYRGNCFTHSLSSCNNSNNEYVNPNQEVIKKKKILQFSPFNEVQLIASAKDSPYV